jgi:glycerate-2-kinase
VTSARAISQQWRSDMSLRTLVEARLASAQLLDVLVDVVAIGKASREMARDVRSVLGSRVCRQFTVCDQASVGAGDERGDVVVGEHPIPGPGSLDAGARLVSFLAAPSKAACTLFLLSGGASSLCVAPAAPLTLSDLRAVWDAALTSGVDITTLNKIRAATSSIAGGAVLRHVQTSRSESLILVDNVISGARWVASSMTYDYRPERSEVTALLGDINLVGSPLRERLVAGFEHRASLMETPVHSHHENLVLAEPAMMLRSTIEEAARRGYRIIDMGSRVHGDVELVSEQWKDALQREVGSDEPVALIGVGEVTVRVRGGGRGGRCQEFAWSMANVLADLGRESVFVARASDGRDFIEGVGGAWVDHTTKERARLQGIEWSVVMEANDSYTALSALDQLLEGGHTGWNLCDVYVALM